MNATYSWGFQTTAQLLGNTAQSARGLHLHGLLGEPEAGGNVFLGHALEFSEDKNFTAVGGKCINRIHQHFNFLLADSGVSGIGLIIYDEQQ